MYHRLFRIYTFQAPTRIVFGPNSLSKLLDEIKKFDTSSILIVSGRNVCNTEGYKKIYDTLSSISKVYEFNDVISEPDSSNLLLLAKKARELKPSLIIGIGGGSSLDMAKIASILVTNDKDPISYFKGEIIQNRGPPIVTIPTLSGTGSEITPISVVIDNGKKLALYHSFLYPSLAIIDPMLSISAPPNVTVSAGIDALCHAIESIMSIDSNSITESLAFEAIRLSDRYLERAYCNGDDIEARTAIAMASLLSALSFMNTGLCLPHGIAYTYAVDYKLPHGISVAIPQPYVVEFNSIAIPDKISLIASAFNLDITGLSNYEISTYISSRLLEIMENLNIPTNLSDIGVEEKNLEKMVDDLLKNYSRFITKNPRKPSRDDLLDLYQQMFEGYSGVT